MWFLLSPQWYAVPLIGERRARIILKVSLARICGGERRKKCVYRMQCHTFTYDVSGMKQNNITITSSKSPFSIFQSTATATAQLPAESQSQRPTHNFNCTLNLLFYYGGSWSQWTVSSSWIACYCICIRPNNVFDAKNWLRSWQNHNQPRSCRSLSTIIAGIQCNY